METPKVKWAFQKWANEISIAHSIAHHFAHFSGEKATDLLQKWTSGWRLKKRGTSFRNDCGQLKLEYGNEWAFPLSLLFERSVFKGIEGDSRSLVRREAFPGASVSWPKFDSRPRQKYFCPRKKHWKHLPEGPWVFQTLLEVEFTKFFFIDFLRNDGVLRREVVASCNSRYR